MNTTENQNEAVVAYCRTCGKPLSDATKREVYGVIYCEDCLASRVHGAQVAGPGMPQPGTIAYVPSAPNPGLAFILGWIPGVGAMYNGQVAKGFVHVGIFALIITTLNSGNESLQTFFALVLTGFIFYMPFEAYQTAKSLRMGQPVPDYLRILHGLDSIGLKSDAGRTQAVPVQPGQTVYAQNPPVQGQPVGAQPVQSFVATPVTVLPVETAEPERFPLSAIVLIVLGGLFLLSTLDRINLEGRYFFPMLLIALGVWLAARRLIGRR